MKTKRHIPTFRDVFGDSPNPDDNISDDVKQRARDAIDGWSNLSIQTYEAARAAGRDRLLADEQRRVQKAQDELDEFRAFLTAYDAAHTITSAVPDSLAPWNYNVREGIGDDAVLLGPEQRLATRVSGDRGDESLRFGHIVRAMLTGRRGDLTEPERRALGENADGAGAVFVPTLLASQMIDLARASSVVIAAGAQTLPMGSDKVTVAKVTGDPDPAWRAEHSVIPERDSVFAGLTLNARALACVVRVSRELAEDAPNIVDIVGQQFARQAALKIDYAALRGSGTADEPLGVRFASGVTITSLAADGRAPTYADLVDAIGRLQDANEAPSARIYHPRTARTFAKLADSTGQPLQAPGMVAAVPERVTSQIPVNITHGVNTDTSEIYVGDFSHVIIGTRTELRVEVLRERYMPDAGHYGLLMWLRADIGVARPAAFNVLTGVRP